MIYARRALLYCLLSVLINNVFAQSILPATTDPAPAQAASPRLIAFSDIIDGQPDGALTVTFSLYPDQPGAAALWTETQVVQVTGGKYSVLLGSTDAAGLPAAAFTSSQAHWLGVQVNGTEKRHLLVSVPYAMKAVEAETFGGLLPSQYVTLAQLQSILQNSTSAGSNGSNGTTVNPGPIQNAAAAGSTPQPATDFTDNNDSEVLLVTQQGTGYAIHAISTGGPRETIFAENDVAFGTAMRAFASAQSSQTIGLLAEVASPDGISGVFLNRAGGKILSLRNTFGEVASVDQNGNINTSGSFSGNGFGLTNIPPSAVGAQSGNFPNAIVQRDANGSFVAGQITAQNFIGNGFGLANVPPSAVGAQSGNFPGAIVQRDLNGDFVAGQISAQNFIGNGFGLTNISPTAVGAQSGNFPGAIVQRDASGNFVAGQISAQNFIGNGFGLMNISPSAVGAQSGNFPGAIVQRDLNGDFVAGQISAQNFIGNGFGLTNISPAAVGAQSGNFPGAIIVRDASGNFAAGQISAGGLVVSGNADFTAASSTAPVKAVLSANTPTSCTASKELLIKTDAPSGQQLFICNANGNGYVLVGDGTATGLTGLSAGDGSVAIGGTTSVPTVSVANGGITTAKLAANAVTSANIIDGSLSPSKIAGTAATLGSNNFNGSQSVSGNMTVLATLTTNGFNANNASIGGTPGTALTVSGGNTGIPGSSPTAIFSSAATGKLISGRLGNGPAASENFAVDTAGNVLSAGALTTQYPLAGSITFNTLVKLVQGPSGVQAFQLRPGDTSPAVGVGISVVPGGPTGNLLQVAYEGIVACNFDFTTAVNPGDYVGVSSTSSGFCRDIGPSLPTDGRQVIGRVVGIPNQQAIAVMLFGPEQHSATGGTLTSINTGAGLAGGPITSSGTISIANGGVTNNMLQNSTITVGDGIGIGGGGTVALGGSITLTNLGALSFNGRVGNIIPTFGDYSFSQIVGTASASQMPLTAAFTDQSNTFTANQTINGSLTTKGLVAAGPSTPFASLVSVTDNSAAGNQPAFSVGSSNNQAAMFISNGPTILAAGTLTHGVLSVNNTGMVVTGSLAATSFSGDGSALTNVTAARIGTLTLADIATSSALSAETSARQTADTTLQSNITAEISARQADVANLQTGIASESVTRASADNALSSSISAETTARQSDVANLQASINTVNSADAKLAASNTYTAGTQDLSGAAATLPVHAVLSSNTPASCVAGKELLIKTDALPGQQLFICDSGGTMWNLVGDGATGGVTSFNGRSGTISPSANDYSFTQIAGSVAPTQLPALSGDITSNAGSAVTTLAPTGVLAGSYTRITVDGKGRATAGGQAAFSDLAGTITAAQLPATVVFSNQANTFSANQTVNATVTANLFSGNGSGLTNVNAATLNGIPSNAFAQLHAVNTFTAEQVLSASTSVNPSLNMPSGPAPAGPLAGDIWNNGGVIQYRDNASTTRSLVSTTQSAGLQLLKLIAQITPSTVGVQSCTEQNFNVPGVTTGDVLLAVSQPGNSSPGTNIAIGGWRVSAANTVAIQFCNVSRNTSTPAAGSYTFAVMR